jgi:hypothetical protein
MISQNVRYWRQRKTRDTFVQKKQKPRFIRTYNRSALHKTMRKLTSQTPLTRYPKKNPPAQKRNCCHRGLSVSDTPNSLLPCSSPDEPPMASPPSLLFQTPERERERGGARYMVGDAEAEHHTKQRINAAKPLRVTATTYPCVLWRGVCTQMRYGRGVSFSLVCSLACLQAK